MIQLSIRWSRSLTLRSSGLGADGILEATLDDEVSSRSIVVQARSRRDLGAISVRSRRDRSSCRSNRQSRLRSRRQISASDLGVAQVLGRRRLGWTLGAFGTSWDVHVSPARYAGAATHMKPPPPSELDDALLSPMPGAPRLRRDCAEIAELDDALLSPMPGAAPCFAHVTATRNCHT